MLPNWLNLSDDPRHWTPAAVAVLVGVIVVVTSFILYWMYRRSRFPYERRMAARRGGETVRVTIGSDTEPPETICPAVVLDRSMGGLGLAVEEPLDVGTFARMRLTDDPSFTWTRFQIKSCQKEEKYWKLSCRFMHLPEWAVLRGLR